MHNLDDLWPQAFIFSYRVCVCECVCSSYSVRKHQESDRTRIRKIYIVQRKVWSNITDWEHFSRIYRLFLCESEHLRANKCYTLLKGTDESASLWFTSAVFLAGFSPTQDWGAGRYSKYMPADVFTATGHWYSPSRGLRYTGTPFSIWEGSRNSCDLLGQETFCASLSDRLPCTENQRQISPTASPFSAWLLLL